MFHFALLEERGEEQERGMSRETGRAWEELGEETINLYCTKKINKVQTNNEQIGERNPVSR